MLIIYSIDILLELPICFNLKVLPAVITLL